jgi:hypothetical protein
VPALPHPPAAVNQICPRIAGAESGARSGADSSAGDPRIRGLIDPRIHGFIDPRNPAAGDPLGLLPAGAWYRGKYRPRWVHGFKGKAGQRWAFGPFAPLGSRILDNRGNSREKGFPLGRGRGGATNGAPRRRGFLFTTF